MQRTGSSSRKMRMKSAARMRERRNMVDGQYWHFMALSPVKRTACLAKAIVAHSGAGEINNTLSVG